MNLKKIVRSSFPLLIFVFIFTSVFAFLKFSGIKSSSAVSLDNFNPGNIITDYVMSKYDSMTEREIQAFLDEKGNCNDTRTYLADYYTKVSYHIKDGHFVCLADETFGNGTDYGEDAPNGDSAAHIIYEAAHDYKINPQVLIVLLQKEQGLITDSWPNSVQYRSATGYGCPDTAACSTKYYGFKNQVRNAAALFRTVLDGGWTNYPVGNNYIQYNPDSSCGGSTVYIENLATSSLYRYTPYQPNASALAAGYGTGNSCSAYGNRNFYLYFNDWFGSSTEYGKMNFGQMVIPRSLKSTTSTIVVDFDKNSESKTEKEETIDFDSVIKHNGETCLRSVADTKNNKNRCYYYSGLIEIPGSEYSKMTVPRRLFVKSEKAKSRITSEYRNSKEETINKYEKLSFVDKVSINGELCLRTEEDSKNGYNRCYYYNDLSELIMEAKYIDMQVARELYIKADSEIIDMESNKKDKSSGEVMFFNKKSEINGKLCLSSEKLSYGQCVPYENLLELGNKYEDMIVPRSLTINKNTFTIATGTSVKSESLKKGEKLYFVERTYVGNNQLCLRAKNDADDGIDACVLYIDLNEE